jgi:hypothetical protein
MMHNLRERTIFLLREMGIDPDKEISLPDSMV